jgi:MFS transporter, PPP family, 3-phenylpropionic acid transporter
MLSPLGKRPIGFAALQFMTWATFAFYFPFVVVILTERGMSNTQIGLILMINSLVGIVAQPVLGFIADRIRSIRKVIIGCMLAIAMIILCLPLARPTGALFIFMPLYTLFSCSINPLLDNWTYVSIKNQPGKSYGAARLWGSIGWVPAVILAGRLVKLFSVNVISLIFPIMCLLTVVAFLLQPELRQTLEPGHVHQGIGPMLRSLGGLLKNYSYVTYVLFGGFLFMAIMPMNSFLIKLMYEVGGNQEQYSWAVAVNAISEVPVFIASRYLMRRIKPVSIICVSSVFFCIRLIILSTATTPAGIIASALLHGPCFALYLTGAVSYIESMAPTGLKATAQTMANAIISGLSGIVGNAAGGYLIDNFGVRSLFRVGIYICCTVTVLFFISLPVGRWLAAGKQQSGGARL